jgi:polyisoprenoid-binding protein YceI
VSPALRRNLLVAAALVVVGVLAAVWFLTRPAPEGVAITDAVDQLPAATEEAAASPSGSAAAGVTADGTWEVDTSIGTFSVEETTGTFVGFRVDEELANVGATTAVGRTPAVSGSITLDGTTLTAAEFSADLTQLVSDQQRRDGAIQRALETGTYPAATFTLTEPATLDRLPAEGETVAVTALGDLTVHGVTRQVQVPLQVSLSGGVAVVTGSFDVTFADYGVEAPTAPVVLSVEDTGLVELQLFLRPA